MKKIKCYDTQDFYKRIHKKDRIVDEKTFGKIVRCYFKNIADSLFDMSNVFLPNHMGILRLVLIDITPSYDIKTGKVSGGLKRIPDTDKFIRNTSNKIYKIKYYKSSIYDNPMRVFNYYKSDYICNKIGMLYKTGQFNSLYYKKS